MILRDESDEEEEQVQVHASEPVIVEAENVIFQKEVATEKVTPPKETEVEVLVLQRGK